MELIKTLSAHLRQARKARGECQTEVARRLGVRQQQISRLENGQGSFEQIVQLCRVYGISLDIRMGDFQRTVVHPLDPDERREIEANIAWFSRLSPIRRLRTIEGHLQAARRLQEAGRNAG